MRISDWSSDVCSSDLLGLLLEFLADDVVAKLHAFIADEHARARNQLAHLVLALPAKRAIQALAAVAGTALSVFVPAFWSIFADCSLRIEIGNGSCGEMVGHYV